MPRLLVLWIVLCLPAVAQLDSDLAPRELEREPGERLSLGEPRDAAPEGVDDSPVLTKQLRAIVLAGTGTDAAGDTGVLPVGLSPEMGEPVIAALAPWVGRPLTANGLDRLTDAILAAYQENGRPVVDIAVPDQDLSGGRLVVEVTEGRVGAVGMERPQLFDDELLGGAIRLREGELLTSRRLQEELDWLSRNPFRPASVYAAPGDEIGEADFVFTFEESMPWRFYTGYENSGVESVGEHRFLAGFNWGNALCRDQLLSYQVTVGDSLDRFHAHSLAWEIPIHPLHRFLRLNATWADVEARSREAGTTIRSEGETWAVSAAWGIPLPRLGGLTHELLVGAEFKATDNLFSFGDTSLPGEEVEIVQARLDYRAAGRWDDDWIDIEAALVASPGGLTGRNEDAAFDAFRQGAAADYLYARGKLTWTRRLAEAWTMRLAAEGQLASGKLLAIEQLAFGGYDSVRGYPEADYLADSGYLLSGEIRTPALGLVLQPLPVSTFQLLAFLDHGTGWRHGGGRDSLTGAGAGIRLRAEDLAEIRLDLGFPLGDSGGPELHAGVLVSF